MAPSLVLASTSRYRAELLSRLGVPFTSCAPRCDEELLKQHEPEPSRLALYLAREKARSVAEQCPAAYVLGGDQVVELEGNVLGKPHSAERALSQLLAMRGKSHRLLTAMCLLCPDGRALSHLDTHVLTMEALSEQSLARYVQAEQPLDCAGSYKIEARGIALFSRIQGDDFTAITGLPLIQLSRWLRAEGFALP